MYRSGCSVLYLRSRNIVVEQWHRFLWKEKVVMTSLIMLITKFKMHCKQIVLNSALHSTEIVTFSSIMPEPTQQNCIEIQLFVNLLYFLRLGSITKCNLIYAGFYLCSLLDPNLTEHSIWTYVLLWVICAFKYNSKLNVCNMYYGTLLTTAYLCRNKRKIQLYVFWVWKIFFFYFRH